MTQAIDPSRFNEQQKSAVEQVLRWYGMFRAKKHKKLGFFLSGYAGTGKTTIAKHIAEQCGGMFKVAFIAPTGKAASRLRVKGCDYARTMHQFAYKFVGENDDQEPVFVGKGALDESPNLIVLDEASMVGHYQMQGLLAHDIPILMLGDIGQIPPVSDRPYCTEHNMDVLLDQIERNAGNIVRASMYARQGNALPLREYEDVAVRPGMPNDEQLMRAYAEDAVLLCTFNSTRERMNNRMRRLAGFTAPLPEVGEKVLCTFNQHGKNFMNGEQAIVLDYESPTEEEFEDMPRDSDGLQILIAKSLTDGRTRRLAFNPDSFHVNSDVRATARRAYGGFDFGGCLTVHKSQGSEWEHVAVIEEDMPSLPYAKRAYTAYTRAISRLEVYKGSRA
ncbi:ATP-dependent exonuclease [Burkholderia phage vB_BglM_WTB]